MIARIAMDRATRGYERAIDHGNCVAGCAPGRRRIPAGWWSWRVSVFLFGRLLAHRQENVGAVALTTPFGTSIQGHGRPCRPVQADGWTG
jgi:hypothetical protein